MPATATISLSSFGMPLIFRRRSSFRDLTFFCFSSSKNGVIKISKIPRPLHLPFHIEDFHRGKSSVTFFRGHPIPSPVRSGCRLSAHEIGRPAARIRPLDPASFSARMLQRNSRSMTASIVAGIFLCLALSADALVANPRISSPSIASPKVAAPHHAGGLLSQPKQADSGVQVILVAPHLLIHVFKKCCITRAGGGRSGRATRLPALMRDSNRSRGSLWPPMLAAILMLGITCG
jgi:hypothetical protein